MTKNQKEKTIKTIRDQINLVEEEISQRQNELRELTNQLEAIALEEEDSSTDTELEVGDHVRSINDPHLNRTGTVVTAGSYWVRVRCDKHRSKIFKKAKHNLRLTHN